MKEATKTPIAPPQMRKGKPWNTDRQLAIIRFSPCGKFLVGAGYDAQIRRWDTATEEYRELPALSGHHGWVQTLAFHPDGKLLFSADSWGQLCCWAYLEKTPRPSWSIKEAHDGWIRQLATRPDGKMLATCGKDGVVRLWTDVGKKVQEFKHNEDVYSIVFHPDGKSLVSGDLKGAVRHWDLDTGKVKRTFDAGELYLYHRIQDVGGVRCLVFDTTGNTLAVAGAKPAGGGFVQATPMLLLFDWSTGKLQHKHALGSTRDGFVFDLAWNPAGFWMLVTSGQPGGGKFLFQQPGAEKPFFVNTRMANCHSLAVHPAGQRLVVAATNRGSAGNGRRLTKDKKYPGNYSPLHIWDMPEG